jgi:hypothetical protein
MPAELSQQAVKNRDSLRASNFKFIIACYLVILSLLTMVLYTGFNPMLRPLVILLSIVGFVGLFLRSQTTGNPPRSFNLSDETRGALSESAKKVYDLKAFRRNSPPTPACRSCSSGPGRRADG